MISSGPSRSGAVSAPTCGACSRPASRARRSQHWPAQPSPPPSRPLRCSACSTSCASRRGMQRPLPHGDLRFSGPTPRHARMARASWCSEPVWTPGKAAGPHPRPCVACGPTNGSATRCTSDQSRRPGVDLGQPTARPLTTGPTPLSRWSKRRARPASHFAPSSASARRAIVLGSRRRCGRSACRTSWPIRPPAVRQLRRIPPAGSLGTVRCAAARQRRRRASGCRWCCASRTVTRRRGGRRSTTLDRMSRRTPRARSP